MEDQALPVVVGSIQHVSNEHTARIRQRRKGSWKSEESWVDPPKKTGPRTWRQWEEHVASRIIKGIVWFVPRRYNRISGDVVDVTPWEDRLRVQWLDRGLYKRKILAAAILSLLIVALFVGAGYIPWRQVFGKDSIPEFKDAHGRILHSVVVPRMLEPDKDVGDASIADWILSGDPFEPITSHHIVETGFMTVRMDHSGTRKNVSLPMLYERMNSTSYGKYRCLCAAHVGIPLNVILFIPMGKRLQMIQDNPDTPPLPNDFVFMLEPRPTVGSNAIISTGPMSSNLEPKPFRVNHPTRVVVSFLTSKGHKDKRELHGDDSACAVRCIEIAWKEKIVEPELGGGILTVPAWERKERGQTAPRYVFED